MSISAYLRRLREKVGHDLVLMPAAAAIVFDERGCVLLVREIDNGRWGTPGGSLEPDESPADGAVRETWEETGLLVEPARVLGVYGGPEFHVTYANGDQVSYVGTVFECRIVGGEVRLDQADASAEASAEISDEVSDAAYFLQADVAALDLPPLQRVILDEAFGRRRAGVAARFRPPVWRPPADGAREGGVSDYLHDLREKVGHDLLLVPAVGAIIRDRQGRVLLQQRADNGWWHPPAGAIEPHEHPADAVAREVWEETGLLVEPVRVTGVYGGADFYSTYPNGDRIVVYSVMFECRVIGGRACPDGVETLDVRYFAPGEMTGDLMPRSWQRRLADALEGRDAACFDPPAWRPS